MDQSHTRFTYCTAPYRYPAYVTAVAAAATLYRVAQVPYSIKQTRQLWYHSVKKAQFWLKKICMNIKVTMLDSL